MNKNAITFFSLFSLILILSVYYILLPPIESNDFLEVTSLNTLQEKLDLKRSEQYESQNQILASSSSTGFQLNEALEIINENKKFSDLESRVKTKLNDMGYSDVFCEICDDVIKITIKKEDASKEDVIQIMECVDDLTNQKYSPELKFIDEWLAILSEII